MDVSSYGIIQRVLPGQCNMMLRANSPRFDFMCRSVLSREWTIAIIVTSPSELTSTFSTSMAYAPQH
jgi:hypothetical protein